MKKNRRGFTLIELLIVIALLGALAVALLAALDPLEQIKKGNDTGVRNSVSEIGEALVRYAAVKQGSMPFSTITWEAVGTDTTGSAYQAVKAAVDIGELKSDFFSLASGQLTSIFITAVDDPATGIQKAYVCFRPTSKSFISDSNTKFYTLAGTAGTMGESTSCPSNGGTNVGGANETCYWCVR